MPRAQPASVLQRWSTLAKIKEQRKNNIICQQGKPDARNIQTEVSEVGVEVKQTYGIKVTTILHATEKLTGDLEYLCSLVEKPDPEFTIRNAIVYAHAVITLSTHLDFVLEELTTRDLTPDEEMVKLEEEDVIMMSEYTEASEEALADLEKLCGISLKNN